MYEFFEHTADIGIRVRAATLEQLLAEAARALFSVMVANFDAVQPVQEISLEVPAAEPDDLLRDWLAALLFSFDTRRIVLVEFHVRLQAGGLVATARGEPLDTTRHQLGMEVKAITYHELKVCREGKGWLAEVIVDI
jgi:SHS2 domain-containing protein